MLKNLGNIDEVWKLGSGAVLALCAIAGILVGCSCVKIETALSPLLYDYLICSKSHHEASSYNWKTSKYTMLFKPLPL